jgi:hypothetical protein
MWSDYVFCTPDDIRQRVRSPETVAQLTKAPNTRIGFTANATTNTITTGVPNQFIAWESLVQFANTGGALPAPLVANKDYYVIPSTDTTFQVTDVLGGSAIDLTTAGTGTTVVWNNTMDGFIQSKIDLTKRWFWKALRVDMQQRLPMLTNSWLAYKRWQIDNLTQGMTYDLSQLSRIASLPNMGGYVFDGGSLDLYLLFSLTMGLHPVTFSVNGGLTQGANGSYAGQAVAGDFIIDSSQPMLYVNKPNPNTPKNVNWVHPTAELILDNLLGFLDPDNNNAPIVPNDLTDMAVEYTLWAMSEDGSSRNQVGNDDAVHAQWMENSTKKWMKQAQQSLSAIIPLLKLDLDGDGKVSEFEFSLVNAEMAVFS